MLQITNIFILTMVNEWLLMICIISKDMGFIG